jgi:hypothetical protein
VLGVVSEGRLGSDGPRLSPRIQVDLEWGESEKREGREFARVTDRHHKRALNHGGPDVQVPSPAQEGNPRSWVSEYAMRAMHNAHKPGTASLVAN